MAVSEQDAPFTEAYGLPSSKFKSKGNTALAVKRALAHLGFLEWEPEKWDKQWNEKVNTASYQWKRKRGLISKDSTDGSWGKGAHDEMRSTNFGTDKKPAFDGESQRLLQEEKKAAAPATSKEDAVRKKITEFAERAINEPWNYSQNRAIDISVDPDADNNNSDCSGSAIQCFHFAKRETGLNVQDPAQQGWSGYGNTNYYEDDWPTCSAPYKVGDLAHYDGHVTVCYHPGDANSADWFSFGSEPPSSRKLHYRSDFRKVVRPKLLA